MSDKKYRIDRTVFIEWYYLDDYLSDNIQSIEIDLMQSGEVIITASELLNKCESVPVELLEDYDGFLENVFGEQCELIYKNPFK